MNNKPVEMVSGYEHLYVLHSCKNK
ncbi:hypothetical protein THOM_1167 [Trachipleistophora hominis]|uniref:Uncharacterized protein n=1 Tax=Trachipleistophora hominis TaxID=72359 RepID=L7JYP8_TRAHO|nr:hypothetical protein THOM_1167 [Trachipleistophora hominis]